MQAMQDKYIKHLICNRDKFPLEWGSVKALNKALIWSHLKYLCNSTFMFKKDNLKSEKVGEKKKKRLLIQLGGWRVDHTGGN